MALGKYSRIDGRRSPMSYCSTATFVVFIGLCLVGVWMITSSSIVPVQNIEETTQELKTQMPAQLKEADESNKSSDNNSNSESNEGSENGTSDNSNSNSESNDTNSDNNSNSEGNTDNDRNSENESNTTSDNNLSTESNTGSSNDESNTSKDSKSDSESNTSSQSSSDDESNTSSDSKTNAESDKSSSNDESNTSGDSKSDTESNTDSESTQSNKNSENNTDNERAKSNINSESNTNSESKPDSESKSDSESTESNTNLESTSGSNADNESQSKQFDDNPGNLPEDATKGDNITVSSSETNSFQPGTTSEQRTEDNQGKNPVKQSEKEDTNAENGSKSETGNEEDKKEDTVSEKEDKESKDGGKKPGIDETSLEYVNSSAGGQGDSKEDSKETTSKSDEGEIEPEMSGEPQSEDEQKKSKEIRQKKDLLLSGAHSELLNQTATEDGAWKTQVAESKKEAHKSLEPSEKTGSGWKLCNVTAGPDYIPCLDNLQAIRSLKSNKHYEHRERHCPDDLPTCLVSLPEGYQRSVEWPTSREKIWYHNVPHTKLAEIKGHQNWVKFSGEYLTFPGGGTQFKHGALHYIDFIQEIAPDIAWGKRSRVVLDVGCGVASFGGFLFERDVLTMSFAPKDEHEAQVQFALERGIPAFLAVMGTKRLPFPGKVFDVVHCARCRVPWHIEGGKLLLELNRLLRPGGYFVWSATPIYRIRPQDVQIWEAMKQLAKDLCWELITIRKDTLNEVGVAVFQKPSSNKCYETRQVKKPPMCEDSDDPNASWNVPLQVCMHKIPDNETERGSKWPEQWPARVEKPPYWLLSSQVGVYGRPAPDDFVADDKHWKRVVSKSYVTGLGINWSTVRNVMDMRAVYGGLAAALKDLNVWVMNVVNVDAPDTLPIIYERGLFGMYHDWCESFSTYPRTYDLIHADHLFSRIKKKCNFEASVVEVDRILRPEGKLIVRDKVQIISELETMFKSMQWEVQMSYAKDNEGLLCVQKAIWRPTEAITIPYAIA
ncbi:putative methyltransferase PMT26 [Heracleum sosnowskyi]|uniref:Methyltransferase PMT26 n=1 Tax=Heracleum sosnowskyi TaxID=360622 RepID=A0AAD8HRB4_9APIA|nr:putative methyltransferase PMT26 [Heracleum sosnowskyi]